MQDGAIGKTPLLRGLFISGKRRAAAVAALVLFLCVIPFAPGLTGPFMLDDTVNLQRILVGDVTFGAIYDATFSNLSGPTGRPLSNLSFIANQLVTGYQPYAYKLVNLALHFLCGVLVFLLAQRLLSLLQPNGQPNQHRWIALGAAALWTIHPLQVSSTLYVVQRMTQLASIFMVLSVMFALRHIDTPTRLRTAGQGIRHAVLVGAVALVALLCKENGALVPFLLVAVFLALPDASRHDVTDSPGKMAFWISAAALPVTAAVILSIAFWDQLTAGFAFRQFTVSERLLSEPLILGGYLKSFFLPDLRDMGLFLDDSRILTAADPIAWVGVAMTFLLVTGAWWFRRRLPVFAFAVFWFLACHLMESTFAPLELAFEHRNYLALFGPSLLVATGIAKLGDFTRARVPIAVACAVLLTFGALTFQRSVVWSDHVTFHLTAAKHHPDSMRAQTSAAAVESFLGDNSAAIRRIRSFRTTHPEHFFPFAMDMDLACEIGDYNADWRMVTERLRADPYVVDAMGIYQTVAQKVLRGECSEGFDREFRAHITEVVDIYRDAGASGLEQFYLMLAANLQADPARGKALYDEALALHPNDRVTLFQYAYFALNNEDPEAAATAIRRLRRQTPWWHPESSAVAELEGFLELAMDDASTNRPASAPNAIR